jgi:hypothetical protein
MNEAECNETKPKPKAIAKEMTVYDTSGILQSRFMIDAEGHDVFHWPEFQALAKRLMIDLEAPITCVTIRVACDEFVGITTESKGLDRTKDR